MGLRSFLRRIEKDGVLDLKAFTYTTPMEVHQQIVFENASKTTSSSMKTSVSAKATKASFYVRVLTKKCSGL